LRRIAIKFLAVLYNYYNKGGTKSIPYESALTAFIGILLLYVYSLGIWIFGRQSILLMKDYSRVEEYLIAIPSILLLYFFLSRFITKDMVLTEVESGSLNMRDNLVTLFLFIGGVVLFIFTVLKE
jgi:hypothetical protein